MLFGSLLKIRFHDVSGPAEDIDGLLEVLSDNCQNRAQNNTVVVQQEKMDRVGVEPTTSAAQQQLLCYEESFALSAPICPHRRNTGVQSVDIVDGQVANSDLGTDAVTSTKIKNGEVKTEDIASGAIQLNIHRVQNDLTLSPGAIGSLGAECPSGETLVGGGFKAGIHIQVYHSFPSDIPFWLVEGVYEGTGANEDLEAMHYA